MTNDSDGDVALDAGTVVAITDAAPVDGGTAPDLDLSLKNIPTGTCRPAVCLRRRLLLYPPAFCFS